MAAQRILFVIMDLHGGAGIYCRILASALNKEFGEEFESRLLVLRDRGILPEDRGVFREIDIIGQANRWRQIWKMRLRILAVKADCIICVGTFANLLVPILAPRVPAILTVHGNYSHLMAESRLAWVLEPMLKWRFARQLVVAPAEGVAEDLRENFNAADVRVIPHGIDSDSVAKMAAAPLGLSNEPYMLAVGRLAKQKDYPTMLRAYAIARKRGMELPLVIVGDGPEEAALRELTHELGINECVRFQGHRENPFPYMRGAEFLVLSSTWEGFGLVLIEAMSLRVPCISTDCPSGPGEILGNGKFGLLVPVENAEKLAEAILKMHEPGTRQNYSELAHRRSKDYTLSQMAIAYRALIDESATMRP